MSFFLLSDEPVVTVPSVKLNVNFGDNITLPCEVNAVPSHTEVYWTHNKDGIVRYIYFHTSGIAGVEPSYPSLVIQTVTTTDSGFYTCFSKNIVGTGASQQLHLTVRGGKPLCIPPYICPKIVCSLNLEVILKHLKAKKNQSVKSNPRHVNQQVN